MINMTGIPTAPKRLQGAVHQPGRLRDVYHTVTSCAFPCTGTTGTAFPLANGATKHGLPIDFDSSELGYGLPRSARPRTPSTGTSTSPPSPGSPPGDVVTYYCRIHPGMRGAVEVFG